MKRSDKKKPRTEHFAMLPVSVIFAPAVATLPHPYFRVLTLIAAQFRGNNNGALGVTAKQAKAAGIGSNHTLYRALNELVRRQLIEITYPSSRVPPRPTMFAVTWFARDETKYSTATKIPTHGYRDWLPDDGNSRRKRRCTQCTQGGAPSALKEMVSG